MIGGTVRTRFVPFASRSYQNLYLTVKEGVTQYTLEEMLRNEIMKRGGKNIYHVIIQGTRSREAFFWQNVSKQWETLWRFWMNPVRHMISRN